MRRRLKAAARQRALQRVADAHRGEYERYLRDEMDLAGIPAVVDIQLPIPVDTPQLQQERQAELLAALDELRESGYRVPRHAWRRPATVPGGQEKR